MKRMHMSKVFGVKKRVCKVSVKASSSSDASADSDLDLPSDTKAALLVLHGLFPVEKFNHQLPPIILKHQIYSIVLNRTQADKELDALQNKNEIRVIKLGAEDAEYCVVLLEDYCRHIRRSSSENTVSSPTIEKFLTEVIPSSQAISYTTDDLCHQHGFKDEQISELIHAGVLTVCDVGCWWLAIPNSGLFLRNFRKGRNAVLQMISRSKYRELHEQELHRRKLPKMVKFSMEYQLHDIIGAELVKCINTTSGKLLRFSE